MFRNILIVLPILFLAACSTQPGNQEKITVDHKDDSTAKNADIATILSKKEVPVLCYHHIVTDYKEADWDSQLVKPQRQLEAITGKPVKYFAYPFGIWDSTAITEIKNHGYKLAFILSGKRDSTEPLFTLRRMIVPGQWT